ncbi:MAG: hypothetical protein K8L97_24810 [Anaerolineae bacterium]|nr:hypothetical protein [Anaerolineae bacterium]
MRKVVKISVGTAVFAVLLGTCFSLGSLALFLQTFFALTRETPVAEVIMSPIQNDEKGDYIEIVYTPYNEQSALLHIVNNDANGAVPILETSGSQTYKIYGDTVAVRGPMIKLHPALLILNFENVYKLSLIEGEYRRQQNRASGEGTEVTINGGFDDFWWDVNNEESTFPYNLIVDRVTFSGDEEPGFTGTGKKRYQIVVTMDSITWNFIEKIG